MRVSCVASMARPRRAVRSYLEVEFSRVVRSARSASRARRRVVHMTPGSHTLGDVSGCLLRCGGRLAPLGGRHHTNVLRRLEGAITQTSGFAPGALYFYEGEGFCNLMTRI